MPLILRSTELNTFSMTNTIYRGLMCRANGGIYRLRGGTPWRYDGKASCMSKQTVSLLYWFWRQMIYVAGYEKCVQGVIGKCSDTYLVIGNTLCGGEYHKVPLDAQ